MKRILLALIVFCLLAFQTSAGPPGSPPVGPETDLVVRSASMGTPYLAIASNTVLSATQVQNYVITLTGDGTQVTLPLGSGLTNTPKVTIYIGDATAKHIKANAADAIILRGTTLAAGNKVSIGAGNTGKAISLMWNGTNWITGNAPGEFTDGGI
jgi:hypothetical protein